MNTDTSYKLSLTLALILHASLIVCLLNIFSKHNKNYVLNNLSDVGVLKAVVVVENSKSNETVVEKIEQKNQQTVQQPVPINRQKVVNDQKIEVQKTPTDVKKILRKQQVVKQKQIDEDKLKAQQELEKNKAKLSELMHKKMDAELSSEQQQVIGASQAQNHGEVDKYKAMIIQSIAQYWIVPENVAPSAYCKLLIHLAPGGEVLSVTVIHPSGDNILDRSAKTAVLKASPLPVPENPSLFDDFRELTLTARPVGFAAG